MHAGELINEKGVTWRCAAHQPRVAPFHLRFHPLLRRSFRLSFYLLPSSLRSPFHFSFFSLCFVIPWLYVLCQRNPAPLAKLLFPLHRATKIEYFYFSPWLPSRIFPHFSAIMSATSACRSYYMLSLPPMSRLQVSLLAPESVSPRSVVHVHVCRFIRQTRRKAGSGYYIKFDAAKSSLSLCISDFNGNFENCSSG